MPRPPISTLFPYTTLFRSWRPRSPGPGPPRAGSTGASRPTPSSTAPRSAELGVGRDARSEEHTSELQSRQNLVCRLLLEKKNIFLEAHSLLERTPSDDRLN